MHADRIARLLPEIFRAANTKGSVLTALLGVMEAMHERSEQALDELDGFIDTRRAPDDFVLMLSRWLGQDRYLEWSGGREDAGTPRFAPGIGRLRLLLGASPDLARRRGTREALERFLVLATGIEGYRVTENPPNATGEPTPFHIAIAAPVAARRYRRLVQQIVEDARPAYVTYTLAFDEPAAPAGERP